MTRPTNAVSKSLFCVALLADILLTSCGGGTPLPPKEPGSCGAMTACGGAVVGRWNITDTCVGETEDLGGDCVGLTAKVSLTASGSELYNADLTYVETGSTGGTVHYVSPPTCFGAKTCADIEALILAQGLGLALSFQSATCKSSVDGCACEATVATTPVNKTGTYSIASGVLTAVHARMNDSTFASGLTFVHETMTNTSYCVEGNSMTQIFVTPRVVPGSGGVS